MNIKILIITIFCFSLFSCSKDDDNANISLPPNNEDTSGFETPPSGLPVNTIETHEGMFRITSFDTNTVFNYSDNTSTSLELGAIDTAGNSYDITFKFAGNKIPTGSFKVVNKDPNNSSYSTPAEDEVYFSFELDVVSDSSNNEYLVSVDKDSEGNYTIDMGETSIAVLGAADAFIKMNTKFNFGKLSGSTDATSWSFDKIEMITTKQTNFTGSSLKIYPSAYTPASLDLGFDVFNQTMNTSSLSLVEFNEATNFSFESLDYTKANFIYRSSTGTYAPTPNQTVEVEVTDTFARAILSDIKVANISGQNTDTLLVSTTYYFFK